MAKGDNTRSGLLWEVERLLNEVDNLPQILLMENVPQVHGKKAMPDFQKWLDFLKSKGYTSKWQDLNSKDYGVAQNRNRCFMVSWLGNYTYEFPKPFPLTKVMADYLEDEVDEKYYVSSDRAKKLIEKLVAEGTLEDDEGYGFDADGKPLTEQDTTQFPDKEICDNIDTRWKNEQPLTNERTNGQLLTLPCTIPKESISQTASAEEQTVEYQQETKRVAVCVSMNLKKVERVADSQMPDG